MASSLAKSRSVGCRQARDDRRHAPAHRPCPVMGQDRVEGGYVVAVCAFVPLGEPPVKLLRLRRQHQVVGDLLCDHVAELVRRSAADGDRFDEVESRQGVEVIKQLRSSGRHRIDL